MHALFAATRCAIATPVGSAGDAAEPTRTPWLHSLRGSLSYEAGLKAVEGLMKCAYDSGAGGAVAGAGHGEGRNNYYLGLARMKGCDERKPHAEEPNRACNPVSGPEPDVIGTAYDEATRVVSRSARETLYPKRVLQVLLVIHDYGHVWTARPCLMPWTLSQTTSSGGPHEPACADASKVWADDLLDRLKRRIEVHGLPAGAKPQ